MRWTREQLLVAFGLYCQIPFGKLHAGNPQIVECAGMIGRTPSALAMKLGNIASLDPVITSTGRSGLTGASSADRDMWQEMNQDWESFALAATAAIDTLLREPASGKAQDEVLDPAADVGHVGLDRDAVVRVRVGQVFFRRSVLSAYDYRCCISGLSIPEMLIASHIIPWRASVKNRLNPMNGLALSALHDKAFDLGFITLDDDLRVCVAASAKRLADPFFRSAVIAYEGSTITVPDKFRPDAGFIRYHQEHVFRD